MSSVDDPESGPQVAFVATTSPFEVIFSKNPVPVAFGSAEGLAPGQRVIAEVLSTGQVVTYGGTVPTGEAPGAVDLGYTHTQNTANAVWLVQHNLGFRPGGVIVTEADGTVLFGWEIAWSTVNALSLIFAGPFAGTAHIS